MSVHIRSEETSRRMEIIFGWFCFFLQHSLVLSNLFPKVLQLSIVDTNGCKLTTTVATGILVVSCFDYRLRKRHVQAQFFSGFYGVH